MRRFPSRPSFAAWQERLRRAHPIEQVLPCVPSALLGFWTSFATHPCLGVWLTPTVVFSRHTIVSHGFHSRVKAPLRAPLRSGLDASVRRVHRDCVARAIERR
jgi:hypothetical protein